MASRRGRPNIFRQRDLVRAMRSAAAGGVAIGSVEVACKDGTVIRVFGKSAEHTARDSVLTNAADEKRPA
jgi:hydrogenase maturation factor